MNNKIITLCDQTFLPGGKNDLNKLPPWLLVGCHVVSILPLPLAGIFFSHTNKEFRNGLELGPDYSFLIS
jgi:hypothetical protein